MHKNVKQCIKLLVDNVIEPLREGMVYQPFIPGYIHDRCTILNFSCFQDPTMLRNRKLAWYSWVDWINEKGQTKQSYAKVDCLIGHISNKHYHTIPILATRYALLKLKTFNGETKDDQPRNDNDSGASP